MKKLLIFVVGLFLVLSSCNNGLESGGGNKVSGTGGVVDKSRRTVIDAGKYVDFTGVEISAGNVGKNDLLSDSFGTFKREGSNCTIKLDRSEGTITLSTDMAVIKGEPNHSVYARYKFELKAAGENCAYIRMGRREGATVLIDGVPVDTNDISDILLCVPLYGFGQNRLEVSPIMKGYIAMPSGTYWKQ